jgi:hypothetical protein
LRSLKLDLGTAKTSTIGSLDMAKDENQNEKHATNQFFRSLLVIPDSNCSNLTLNSSAACS